MFGIRTALNKGYQKGRISCDYATMRLRQQFHAPAKSVREILFVLGPETLNFDDGRNAYLAVSLFEDAGYQVYLYSRTRLDRRAFHAMGHCARRMFGMKNLTLLDRLPEATESMCLATDTHEVGDEILRRSWKRWVFLNFLRSPELNLGAVIQMPYSMHPKVHSHPTRSRLDQWRQKRRTMRLFFAGNTSKDYYDSHAVKAQGALSRLEALEALKAHRGPIERISTGDAFQKRMRDEQYFKGSVLVETGGFRIAPADWLGTLSHSDFFLCLSGTDYPMCHNAIETMAVGTIPVIGYADWFYPPLEHGVNAVVFTDAKDLEEKVRSVLELPEKKILEMRKNTADYYDRHLSAAGFIRRFEAMPEEPGTLILFPRYRAAATPQELGRAREVREHLGGVHVVR